MRPDTNTKKDQSNDWRKFGGNQSTKPFNNKFTKPLSRALRIPLYGIMIFIKLSPTTRIYTRWTEKEAEAY